MPNNRMLLHRHDLLKGALAREELDNQKRANIKKIAREKAQILKAKRAIAKKMKTERDMGISMQQQANASLTKKPSRKQKSLGASASQPVFRSASISNNSSAQNNNQENNNPNKLTASQLLFNGVTKKDRIEAQKRKQQDPWAKIFLLDKVEYEERHVNERKNQLEAQAKWRNELAQMSDEKRSEAMKRRDEDRRLAELIRKDVEEFKRKEEEQKKKDMEKYLRDTNYRKMQAEESRKRKEAERQMKIAEEQKVMQRAKNALIEEEREKIREKHRQKKLIDEMVAQNAVQLRIKEKIRQKDEDETKKLDAEWQRILDAQDEERQTTLQKIYERQERNVNATLFHVEDIWERQKKDSERAEYYRREYERRQDQIAEERERERRRRIVEQKEMLDKQMQEQEEKKKIEREHELLVHKYCVEEDLKLLHEQQQTAVIQRKKNIQHRFELEKDIHKRNIQRKQMPAMSHLEMSLNKKLVDKAQKVETLVKSKSGYLTAAGNAVLARSNRVLPS
eukprot:TRINITY_DN3597_c1_g4_i1.p1 TRINITY_DN3597_c1_g4~~TRINITY_DN3597_c1_g4_i1.p1  ORF type:complete len:509 (-),score=178.24 TRINITY_DN3597_c1_g4_i1:210-1736(-)